MCGIVAVVRRPSTRNAPEPAVVLAALDQASAALDGEGDLDDRLDATAAALRSADELLGGLAGLTTMLCSAGFADVVGAQVGVITETLAGLEARLDADTVEAAYSSLEAVNAALVRCKDAAWAIQRDRLRTAGAVADLARGETDASTLAGYLSIQETLSALDRLEVRGRDSAGLHVLVRDHDLDLSSASVRAVLDERGADSLFGSGSVRVVAAGTLSFVYKAAAEIGELGDNTRALRDAIRSDTLLRRALSGPEAQAVVLAHTRWASIGIISQANAHPLNSEELDADAESGVDPYLVGVLNGDVDNFADLKATEGLRIAADITTDAKVIPTLTARRLGAGDDVAGAFRRTVNQLEGSVAIAMCAAGAPGDLFLALRGSGQALYVGLAQDATIVASEPYGVVELTDRYLRMDGETPNNADNPASAGQLICLHGEGAGTVEGIERWAYDGTEIPVADGELARAQITTRDIDRGDHPHYLLKEITEAPASFRKTLRAKLVERDGQMVVELGEDVLPANVCDALASGQIKRVVGIGQGTAAVAAQSFAAALSAMTTSVSLSAEAALATELSGFGMLDDMSDMLVVAISQSGTTTDTNRTVDLVRARGGTVLAIVNRRSSDLTDKADGVLYTSDGRDVEMSVASTKAFYSQIAAGFLLASAIASCVGCDASSAERQELLRALRSLPEALERTLEVRPVAAEAAQRFAPSRRYWALVGNGPNRIAANEVRIKLSELCYKSIACDATEDKKHIDLSSEPMILVCAAGLSGSTADDVAKEVAIYRAHKAAPVVVASEGDARFGAAVHLITVPATHPALAFVLSAMAGHLFSYEAALAIDAQAHPLRAARAAIERVVASGVDEVDAGEALLDDLRDDIEPEAARFYDGLRNGEYDGHLEASSASRLASLLRYALGAASLDAYQLEYGRVGTPSVVVEDLAEALTRAIEELTRPVDAIKHQAKTVTVGISRSDETLLQVPLVRHVLGAGVARDRLTYESLRSLATLEPVVREVLGYTRYRIDGRLDGAEEPTAVVVDRGGLGRELRSRTEDHPVLRGTKRRVAVERRPVLARGAADGRTVLIVPEVKDNQPTGITLLHIALADDLSTTALRAVLEGYRDRYNSLVDAVVETEPSFRDDLLTSVPVAELLTAPIYDLAAHWRSAT